MANIKSAQKRAKQMIVKRERNNARRSSIKTAVKKVLAGIEKEMESAKLMELFNDAQAKLARAVGKGVLHKNTASRKIGRLAKRIAVASK
ncbi:MAG TPA: 30S ribosomal protein S20 [Candidatus Babeliales bacterium]|nr:30S ribosomal protein S20 [Candidatus Babeliales bacterium]